MTLKVIGTGVGRTGTYSLKTALAELDLGPCFHMEAILHNMPTQLPLWQAAVQGQPNWPSIYAGYASAVDWPTSGFFRELYATYPRAKFVHTVRSPESWVASFSGTIQKLLLGKAHAPEPMRAWLAMAERVIEKTGFRATCSVGELTESFTAHTQAVQACIPNQQLLIFEVKQGWAPLCEFLGVPTPDKPFPRSNHREEFWDKIKGTA